MHEIEIIGEPCVKEKQNQSVRLTLRWQSRAWQKLPEPVERKNEKKASV